MDSLSDLVHENLIYNSFLPGGAESMNDLVIHGEDVLDLIQQLDSQLTDVDEEASEEKA